MTTGERLLALAGVGGTAAALVDYSGLPTGTAAQHLLVDRAATTQRTSGGGGRGLWHEIPAQGRDDQDVQDIIRMVLASGMLS